MAEAKTGKQKMETSNTLGLPKKLQKEEAFMPRDGSNTSSGTSAPTSDKKATQGVRDQIKKLRSLEDKLWAILGLKMAVDKLRGIGYEVVVQQDEGGCTKIEIQLKVKFDFNTGLIEGKDVVVVQSELEKQIKSLESAA